MRWEFLKVYFYCFFVYFISVGYGEIWMKNKKEIMKKPFEGCVQIGKNKYTGEGFFDDSEEDDKRFRQIIRRIKRERKNKN